MDSHIIAQLPQIPLQRTTILAPGTRFFTPWARKSVRRPSVDPSQYRSLRRYGRALKSGDAAKEKPVATRDRLLNPTLRVQRPAGAEIPPPS